MAWFSEQLHMRYDHAAWGGKTRRSATGQWFDTKLECATWMHLLAGARGGVVKDSNPFSLSSIGRLLPEVEASGKTLRPALQTVFELWVAHGLDRSLPILHSLARSLYVVLPTTVPVERTVSLINRIVSPERACLSPSVVDACVVLRDLSALSPVTFARHVSSALGVPAASLPPSAASLLSDEVARELLVGCPPSSLAAMEQAPFLPNSGLDDAEWEEAANNVEFGVVPAQ